MRLPTPNAEEVESFSKLYLEQFGVELAPAEALEVATRVARLHYVKRHCLRAPCGPPAAQGPAPASERPGPPPG